MRIGHPELRVSLQQGVFARPTLLHSKRAGPNDFRGRHIDTVRGKKAFLLHRGQQRVFGQNGHRAKELQKRSVNPRRHNTDRNRIKVSNCEILSLDLKQSIGETVELGVVHNVVPGKNNIFGSEEMPVAPAQAPAELEGPGLLIRLDGP